MTIADVHATDVAPPPDRVILAVVAAYAAAFVAFGLLVDGPDRVLRGLVDIVLTRDALLTDYFGVGGIGAGLRECGPAHPGRLPGLPHRGRQGHRRGSRLPVPGAGVRPVRQEPAQHLVDRPRRLPVRAFQGRGVLGPHQHRVFRRGTGPGLLRDPVQHRAGRRSPGAAGGGDRASSSASSWHRSPRSCSRRTWASACTTWDSPPASSARWSSPCTSRTGSSRIR